MASDVATRVVETVAGDDGWCSRAGIESLMGATTVDRTLERAVAEGRHVRRCIRAA